MHRVWNRPVVELAVGAVMAGAALQMSRIGQGLHSFFHEEWIAACALANLLGELGQCGVWPQLVAGQFGQLSRPQSSQFDACVKLRSQPAIVIIGPIIQQHEGAMVAHAARQQVQKIFTGSI